MMRHHGCWLPVVLVVNDCNTVAPCCGVSDRSIMQTAHLHMQMSMHEQAQARQIPVCVVHKQTCWLLHEPCSGCTEGLHAQYPCSQTCWCREILATSGPPTHVVLSPHLSMCMSHVLFSRHFSTLRVMYSQVVHLYVWRAASWCTLRHVLELQNQTD